MESHLTNTYEEHRYFNGLLTRAPNTQFEIQKSIASYNLTTPLLKKASDWEVALAGLSLFSQYIPMLTWNEFYTIGILYNDTTLYEEKTPVTNTIGQFIFNLNTVCNAFNDAMDILATRVNTDHPGTITTTPQLFFDEEDQLFKIWCGIEFDATGTIDIIVNRNWFALIGYAFDAYTDFTKVFTTSGSANDFCNFIICREDLRNRYGVNARPDNLLSPANVPTVGEKRLIAQGFSTYETVYKLGSVRVRMQQTPLLAETVQKTSIDNSQETSTSAQNSENVLIDLYPQFSSYSSKGRVVYIPQILSYHSLLSDASFNNFDFEIQWVDSDGNSFQIEIPHGYLTSVKLDFRRKRK